MILKFHVLLAVIAFYNIKHFFILLESIFLQQKRQWWSFNFQLIFAGSMEGMRMVVDVITFSLCILTLAVSPNLQIKMHDVFILCFVNYKF